MSTQQTVEVVTVTLNPAIDRTVTISNFAAGQVNRVERVQSHPGGKGVNVAAVLADYGHTVGVTGFLGRENDASFEDLFIRKQIVDRFVRINGQTRVGIKISDPVLHQTTDINFPGQAPLDENVEQLYRQLADINSAWVVLSGSLPPKIDLAMYRNLIASLKEQGRHVILDTSGEPLKLAIEAVPDIIKPNIHELEEMVGTVLSSQADIVAAARVLIRQGISLVVVSMGKDGACFVNSDSVVVARPPDVTVQSTVGAGDAMVAGIVSAQLHNLSLEQGARLATAFSLDVITHIGSGLSSAQAIEALAQQVSIEGA